MSTNPVLRIFSPEGVKADDRAVAQIEACLADERAVSGALMADHHLGYSMPIGGVIAYDGAISPSGVGFDIACGNKAVRTPLHVGDFRDGELLAIMQEVQRAIAFGVGRANNEPLDHPLFDKHASTLNELDRLAGRRQSLSQKARAQLGTVGSGNHYVDLLADENDQVWIANHFGSRGLGHTIANGFLNLAAELPFTHRGKERDEATVLATDSELGAFYLAAMELAGDYAYAGRDYVTDRVWGVLGLPGGPDFMVHNHHNYAWLENGLWVVRKGATPLTHALAYIGGSMGEGSAIVRGKIAGGPMLRWVRVEDIGALGSAPHGAGRVMSRTAAAGKVKRVTMYGCTVRDCDYAIGARAYGDSGGSARCPVHPRHNMTRFQKLERKSEGRVDWPNVRTALAARGVVVLGSGADEAPEVYKPLYDVLAAHPNIEIVHRLRPLGVVMAGSDTFDPYRD